MFQIFKWLQNSFDQKSASKLLLLIEKNNKWKQKDMDDSWHFECQISALFDELSLIGFTKYFEYIYFWPNILFGGPTILEIP